MDENSKITTYEAGYQELNSIIETLEKGDQSLEKTLELVSRAKVLLDYCGSQLKQAQKQLEVLQTDSDIC